MLRQSLRLARFAIPRRFLSSSVVNDNNVDRQVEEVMKVLHANPQVATQVWSKSLSSAALRNSITNVVVDMKHESHGRGWSFSEVDTNKDGVISPQEFYTWVLSSTPKRSPTIAAAEQAAAATSADDQVSSSSPAAASSIVSEVPPNIEAAAAAAVAVEPPTRQQLVWLGFCSSLVFVAFGICDNGLMLIFGNQIEDHLGLMFGISTMAAAALGNTVSDVVGVLSGVGIESFIARLGIKPPEISEAQRQMKISRIVVSLSSAIGITIGCLIGMFPLLWMDSELSRLRAVFAHIDKNSNGTLSFEEFELAMKELGVIVDEETLLTAFNAADVDRNGAIDFEEFKNAVKRVDKN